MGDPPVRVSRETARCTCRAVRIVSSQADRSRPARRPRCLLGDPPRPGGTISRTPPLPPQPGRRLRDASADWLAGRPTDWLAGRESPLMQFSSTHPFHVKQALWCCARVARGRPAPSCRGGRAGSRVSESRASQTRDWSRTPSAVSRETSGPLPTRWCANKAGAPTHLGQCRLPARSSAVRRGT
jgi:hypothetical protein